MGYEPVVVLFYYEPLSGAAVGGGAMLVAASHYPLLFAPFRGGDVCVMPHCGAAVRMYLPIVGRGRPCKGACIIG